MLPARRLLALLALALAALGLGAAPALARHRVEVAERAGVRATLAWDQSGLMARDVRLTIERRGAVLVRGRVARPCREGCSVYPEAFGRKRALQVRDVTGDGEPEVLFDTYSGGAHCCEQTIAYLYSTRTGRYVRTYNDWADPGHRLRDLDRDGVPEFLSADASFAYLFASFADSAFPVQVWRLRRGAFRDVTRAFPRLIRADARSWYRRYRRVRRHNTEAVRGALAAYAADEYSVGAGARAERVLGAALHRGDLRRQDSLDTYPAGRAYLRALHAFLRRQGYRR